MAHKKGQPGCPSCCDDCECTAHNAVGFTTSTTIPLTMDLAIPDASNKLYVRPTRSFSAGYFRYAVELHAMTSGTDTTLTNSSRYSVATTPAGYIQACFRKTSGKSHVLVKLGTNHTYNVATAASPSTKGDGDDSPDAYDCINLPCPAYDIGTEAMNIDADITGVAAGTETPTTRCTNETALNKTHSMVRDDSATYGSFSARNCAGACQPLGPMTDCDYEVYSLGIWTEYDLFTRLKLGAAGASILGRGKRAGR